MATVADMLTITLGATGYENITVRVHDNGVVGSGLPSWSHGAPWLNIDANGRSIVGPAPGVR
mgnify:CR=1 FL=1